MVLGDAKCGRSSVAQRLVKPTLAGNCKSTTSECGVTILEAGLSPRVSVNVWDFAAEIIARPTHQFFVFENSVFVVVFSLLDTSSMERIDYWIDLILSKVSRANVLLVATHSDRSRDGERVKCSRG